MWRACPTKLQVGAIGYVGPHSARICRTSSSSARAPPTKSKIGRISANLVRSRRMLARSRPNLQRNRPVWAKFAPDAALQFTRGLKQHNSTCQAWRGQGPGFDLGSPKRPSTLDHCVIVPLLHTLRPTRRRSHSGARLALSLPIVLVKLGTVSANGGQHRSAFGKR